MLSEFVAAWPLFRDAFLTAWLLAALLGLAGVLVVARGQIFIGAAISQASILGVAVGLWSIELAGAPAWLPADAVSTGMAIAASVGAALATSRGGRDGEAGPEALTGWVYLFAASAAVLLVTRSPHGLEEVHRLVASSIIGASRADVVIFALLLLGVAAMVGRLHRPLLLLSVDPLMAAAVGVPVGRWNAFISCILGLVIGLAIPVGGVLYAFGCLVLPALVARNLCRETLPMFVVAPAVAVLAAVAAVVVAHRYDLPPGQATVALLCLLVPATRGIKNTLRRGVVGPGPAC